MERCRVRVLAVLASVAVMSGCVSVPPKRGATRVDELVAARGVAGAIGWSTDESAAPVTGEISRTDAVRYAFVHNAQVRELYSRLGLASADVQEAGRLANPRFGYVNLSPSGGGLSQITRSFSIDFTNALMTPSRTRLAQAQYERSRETVADALLELATRVEKAWYEAVGARQVSELRALAATAGDASGDFAQRLYDAGNVSPKALALEQASSGEQRILAARAKAEAIQARAALAELMGLSTRAGWELPSRLPTVADALVDTEAQLVTQAQSLRLDLSAARREVAVSKDLAGVTRRWRWIGDVEGGYERESETDGSRLRGPSLSLRLPIFNQNQSGVLRADAQAEAAKARLDELDLRVRNDIARGLDRLAAAREVAEAYRTALLPLHETVVNRTQEEHNFMLVGVFELLQARRTQLDAYQAYLESVRDYWVARSDLRRAAGGALPGEAAADADPLTPGFDALIAPPSPAQSESPQRNGAQPPAHDQHSEHQHHGETP
jgi:outer membrane protein, heavy metal efflux system